MYVVPSVEKSIPTPIFPMMGKAGWMIALTVQPVGHGTISLAGLPTGCGAAPGGISNNWEIWVLTAEEEYLQTARALLERIAAVYPDLRSADLTHDGKTFDIYVKMTGTFWEGGILTDLAKGVDLLLPGLPEKLVREVHERVCHSVYQAYCTRPAASNQGNR